MRRRTFGSIRKTSSGRWQARYPAPDGRYRPGPHTFDTKAEADRWLADVRRDLDHGTWTDPALRAVTLGTYVQTWLPERPLAPRTRALYADQLRLHILPLLGGYPISKITPATVRSWFSTTTGRTGGTASAQSYRLLRAVLNTAVSDGLIVANPCQIRGAGQVKSPERLLLLPDDVEAIASVIDPHYRHLVTLTFWCHLRLGEVLGLQRRDLDLKARTLRVQRQMVEVNNRPVQTEPKAGSRRSVDIPERAVEALRQHLAEMPLGLPSAPVFTRPDGTQLRHHHVHTAWNRARAKAGLPEARFHDLRHGSLTLAAMTGASLKEVMGRAGHSTVNAAMGYQHNAQHRGREIADEMTRIAEAGRATS